MNKIVTIEIGGVLFQITEKAAQTLKDYLKSLHQHFGDQAEAKEIIKDIEARIAELFTAEIADSKVVTEENVKVVIEKMGHPEDFEDDESAPSNPSAEKKKLFRDGNQSVFGGVCSGLGHYFGIDTVWVRIAFILLSFITVFSLAVISYIVLWIVIPKAKTASERLQMKGKPVNFSNIGRNINEEFEKVSQNFNDRNAGDFFERLGRGILRVLKVLLRIVEKVILAVLSIALAVLLIGLSLSLFLGVSITPLIFGRMFPVVEPTLLSYGLIALICALGATLYFVIRFLGRAVLRIQYTPRKALHIVLVSVMALGYLFAAYIVGDTLRDFSVSAKQTSYLTQSASEEIFRIKEIPTTDEYRVSYFDFRKDRRGRTNGNINFFYSSDEEEQLMYINNIDIYLRPSADSLIRVDFQKKARGREKEQAIERAQGIEYSLDFDVNELRIARFLSFDKEKDMFRAQGVDVEIYIPVGQKFTIEPELARMIVGKVKKERPYKRMRLSSHVWQMTERGLAVVEEN